MPLSTQEIRVLYQRAKRVARRLRQDARLRPGEADLLLGHAQTADAIAEQFWGPRLRASGSGNPNVTPNCPA